MRVGVAVVADRERHRIPSEDGLRLVQALSAEVDYLALEVAEYLRTQIPSYESVPLSTLLPAVVRDLTSLTGALISGHGPDDVEVEALADPADERARQGVPVEGVLATYRAGGRLVWDWVEARAPDYQVSAEDLLIISRALSDWIDAVTAEVALVHRRAEVELARRDARARTEFLHGLLFGALPPAELRVRAATYDLKSGAPYRAFRARVEDEHTRRRLEARLLTVGAEQRVPSFVGMLDTDLAGVLCGLPQLPEDLEEVLCAVGPPSELATADASFRTASRLLDAAVRFGMQGVVTLADLGPRLAIATERELGADLVERYVAPLESMGPFGGELAQTIREYLAQGLRVESTAEALYVHPNTVRHRLQRFEEVTGANPRSFADLVHVWWALERSALDGKAREGSADLDD